MLERSAPIARAGEGGVDHDCVVTLDHLRSIDRQRLVRRFGTVSPSKLKEVGQAILISLGIELD